MKTKPSLAAAFDELSRASAAVAEALRAGRDVSEVEFPGPAAMARKAKAPRAEAPPRGPSLLEPPPDSEPEQTGNKTTRKILVALAQFGRPMTTAMVGWSRLSHRTGPFGSALAQLRKNAFIEGPGSALRITPLGLRELGEYAPLPEGSQLFEFWCEKLGTTPGKILRVLRKHRGEALSAETIGDLAELSHRTGPFSSALALLRKMQLIEGPGNALQLTADFQKALEPTVAVFDRQSGKSIRVGARDGIPRG